MTPNQSDRLSNIEKDIALSLQDRRQMRDDIQEIKQSVKSFDEKLDLYMEKLETKFAPKDSLERLRVIVWAIIGFVFTAIGIALMDNILG